MRFNKLSSNAFRETTPLKKLPKNFKQTNNIILGTYLHSNAISLPDKTIFSLWKYIKPN